MIGNNILRRQRLRTYAIAMTGLAALLMLAGMLTAWNVYASSADPTFALTSSGTVPDWWRATLLYGGIGLALTSLIVGVLRTGTPATPATGAAAFWTVILGVQAAYGVSGASAADHLANAAITALWFATAAFLPYAIGRHGLRRLAAEPNPATRTGRLTLRARHHPVETGCWVALVALYGLLVWVRCADQYGWATVMYLTVVNTVALTAIMIVSAAAGSKARFLLAFALVAQTAITFSMGTPIFIDGCPGDYAADACTALPNGWGVNWNDLGMVIAYGGIPMLIALTGYGIAAAVRAVARRRGRM